jgi:hypothetical protein
MSPRSGVDVGLRQMVRNAGGLAQGIQAAHGEAGSKVRQHCVRE